MADEKTETHETPDGGTQTTKTSHSESGDGSTTTSETTKTVETKQE